MVTTLCGGSSLFYFLIISPQSFTIRDGAVASEPKEANAKQLNVKM